MRSVAIVLAFSVLPIAVAFGQMASEVVISDRPAATPPSAGACGGTPPAAAADLGFTTCAFAIDFTGATPSEHNGTNFTADTLSSWLDCKGASSPLFFANTYSGTVDCNDFSIVDDGGINVLDIAFQPSDVGTYTTTIMQSCSQGYASACGTAAGNDAGFSVPFNFYYEIRERTANVVASCPLSGGCGPMYDDWSYPTTFTDPTWTELDFLEFYSWSNPGLAGSYGSTGGSSQGGWPTQPNWGSSNNDINNYHTYGFLVATDGTSDTQMCKYYDGVEAACSGGNVGGNFTIRMELIDNTGSPRPSIITSSTSMCGVAPIG
jgi:hypothetical protein